MTSSASPSYTPRGTSAYDSALMQQLLRDPLADYPQLTPVQVEAACQLTPGTRLAPNPLWNATTGRWDQLAREVEILAVKTGVNAQHGAMYQVRTASRLTWLSIAWFTPGIVHLFPSP